MKKYLHVLLALLLYLIFFAILFIQYPLNNSLIGNTDAIGTLVIYREHLLKIKQLLFNVHYGNTFYPGPGLTSFCEPYWGETLMYSLLSVFRLGDLLNVYLIAAIIFALNGFSVYCLAHYYTKDFASSIFAGLAFSACSYMLCNNEMMNALAFFPTPFVLLYLERYFDEVRPRLLLAAVIILAVQFYFSTYNFAFGVLLSLFFVVARLKRLITLLPRHWKYYVCFVLAGLLAIAPMYYFIVLSGNFQNAYNPLAQLPGVTERFSLTLDNFSASYPNNLLYNGGIDDTTHSALRNQYYTNLGFVFWGLAGLGLLGMQKHRIKYLLIVVVAILISFGLFLQIGNATITMPLSLLYKIDSIKTFYRIPGRTFVVGAFALAVLSAFGVSFLRSKTTHFKFVLPFLLALLVVENVPFPFPTDRNAAALVPPKGYLEFYQNQKMKVIAELPSSIFTNRFQYVNGISEFSREYRYMYWQTIHKNNSINGSGSFFPDFRMHNNDLMKDISANDNLKELIAYNKLDYITFHKKFVFAEEEKPVGAFLAASNLLAKQFENDEIVIYKVAAEKDRH